MSQNYQSRLGRSSNEISEGGDPAAGVQAVLTSPLSGQFYVIGNPSDVLGSLGSPGASKNTPRTVAPRTTTHNIAFESGSNSSGAPRDDRRRATHNEVERRRRDMINTWIMKLGKLMPPGEENPSKGGSQSKGGILAKACEYVQELRNTNLHLGETVKEGEILMVENERLLLKIEELQNENSGLKKQLRSHGLIPHSTVDTHSEEARGEGSASSTSSSSSSDMKFAL